MPDHASTAAPASDGRWPALAILTGAFAAAAFLAPLWAPEPHRACGLLLFGGAITELVQGFRRRTREGQRAAWQSGGLTLLLGLLIFNMVWIATTALTVIVAIPFALDAIRYIRLAIRQRSNRDARRRAILAAIGNLSVTFGLYLLGRYAFNWVIGAAAGMRLAGAAFNLAAAPVFATTDADESVVADLGIDRPERLTALAARVEAEEQNRVAADWSWVAALFIVLFTIHVSRMGFDRSALGIFSPLVAVVGDAVFALVLAYAVIVPLRLLLRRSSIRLARRGWEWVLDERPVPVTRRPLKSIGALVARGPPPPVDPPAIGPLLDDIGARPRPANRAAAFGRDCRVRADLGHELVFRHGELGVGRVGFVGGRPHGHVARCHGARGHRRRRERGRRNGFRRVAARRRRIRAVLVHRDRRHGRRRLQPACASRSAHPRGFVATMCGLWWCHRTSSIRPAR